MNNENATTQVNNQDNIPPNVNNASKCKHYEREFIEQVIGVYKSGIYKNVTECANAYNVNPKTLHAWLKKHNKQNSPDAISKQQEEIAQLKKELSRAKMENEILKKASIYFANLAR